MTKLDKKGYRKGLALKWQDLLNGDAALAAAPGTSMRHQGLP
ncbi:hypothetical protein [Rhodanobacter sp. C05]|nr:hypothetical protein [Rhodanobacter sp. C05]